MSDYECPVCETEFEAPSWESGKCPKCGNKYEIDEMCTEDYSDCWMIVEWEKYK
jgi:peptide subunit release factor 1 (eRF1)